MTLYDESDDSTSWDERREFEERISKGFALTSAETRRLIRDAEAGERASAIVSALEQTLKERFGMVCVDATTDDGVFYKLGAADTSTCNVTYVEPAAAGEAPTITVDVSDCS